ncbi:Primosomal protein N' [Actinomyces bovis]|uniref:Probable replication restart protein PriA n=1 Tax=Actinomyces bovis TaxID=1658 RepID=A0ABY1VQ32_9ACTO|nr:primosomal protein N' [Actinomyces bovis]SPT54039.1 Primosomal protein N' [Actinomyces bovis]VEG53801.1 Primosomal protein N' [Actinomyces israelii]
MSAEVGEQGTLLAVPAPVTRRVQADGVLLPVAQVLLDTPLPQLDRLFDYLVPPALDAAAQVGTRVVVRFGGQESYGWIWGRSDSTSHRGRLAPLRRVVSDMPVLTEATRALVEAVATRAAGSRADVVRLAVPPRHRGAENSERDKPAPRPPAWTEPKVSGWADYMGGTELLHQLANGGSPRAIWHVLPHPPSGQSWLGLVARAARATLCSGRGVLLLLATNQQVVEISQRLSELLPGEAVVQLGAEVGPAARYRSFTRLLLGHARVVVGTRAAAYAPVKHLGLAVIWDDGDDRLDERRAPYTHARQVLALRSSIEGTGLLIAGHTVTPEAQALVERGWATVLAPARDTVLTHRPRVEVPGTAELSAEGASGGARIPSLAHRAVRAALEAGPVLVQVPRGGYAPVVACEDCRQAAKCKLCGGPVALQSDRAAACRWCSRPVGHWRCAHCGGQRLRMVAVGTARTAEELARAFSGAKVVVSGTKASHGVIHEVDAAPRLVVATPGAEPVAEGGYRAVLLLDGAVLSSRPELGAQAEALRRWSNAAALAAPDARVLLLGRPEPDTAQALLRWDQPGFARAQLLERDQLHLPPAWRTARLDGARAAVEAVLEEARGAGFETLGPSPMEVSADLGAEGLRRALVRVPVAQGRELASLLRRVTVRRALENLPPVRVELDPTVLW